MSEKDTGGPAFPTNEDLNGHGEVFKYNKVQGMTLRDYFAGKALVGMLSNDSFLNAAGKKGNGTDMEHQIANMAGAQADAMLKERTK